MSTRDRHYQLAPSECSVSGSAPRCIRHSRCLPMVIIQQPAKPLAPFHCPDTVNRRSRQNNQPVSQALMIPLKMIMSNEFVHGIPQGTLTKEDHSLQAAFLNTADEPFRVSVQIGLSRWQFHRFNATLSQHGEKFCR
jgi:hypothetical protein